ncbi:DUF6691 family protein [Aliiroseovarius lamellibrachiae]|uniref:DUF6691 family protein n=1 Tax=Aliiroseovarius lamellibrachiae TaxID=1924933 RepID=UPI0031B84795
MKHINALLTGLVFGVGIAIAGMMTPATVFNVFDSAGTWALGLALFLAAGTAGTYAHRGLATSQITAKGA